MWSIFILFIVLSIVHDRTQTFQLKQKNIFVENKILNKDKIEPQNLPCIIMQAWFKNLRWRAINTVCFLYKYLSPSQRVRFSLFFRFQSYFYSHGLKHFPSNCPSLLLLYLKNIKWPYTRYHTYDKKLSNLWGVIVTTCLMSNKDTFTCPPILHASTGLIRNFCIANNTLCLRSALFFVTIFSQFLRGVTVVAHKLKSKLMQNFGCIMCIFW